MLMIDGELRVTPYVRIPIDHGLAAMPPRG